MAGIAIAGPYHPEAFQRVTVRLKRVKVAGPGRANSPDATSSSGSSTGVSPIRVSRTRGRKSHSNPKPSYPRRAIPAPTCPFQGSPAYNGRTENTQIPLGLSLVKSACQSMLNTARPGLTPSAAASTPQSTPTRSDRPSSGNSGSNPIRSRGSLNSSESDLERGEGRVSEGGSGRGGERGGSGGSPGSPGSPENLGNSQDSRRLTDDEIRTIRGLLDDAIRRLRHLLAGAGRDNGRKSDEELNRLPTWERRREKATRFVQDHRTGFQRSVVCFASLFTMVASIIFLALSKESQMIQSIDKRGQTAVESICMGLGFFGVVGSMFGPAVLVGAFAGIPFMELVLKLYAQCKGLDIWKSQAGSKQTASTNYTIPAGTAHILPLLSRLPIDDLSGIAQASPSDAISTWVSISMINEVALRVIAIIYVLEAAYAVQKLAGGYLRFHRPKWFRRASTSETSSQTASSSANPGNARGTQEQAVLTQPIDGLQSASQSGTGSQTNSQPSTGPQSASQSGTGSQTTSQSKSQTTIQSGTGSQTTSQPLSRNQRNTRHPSNIQSKNVTPTNDNSTTGIELPMMTGALTSGDNQAGHHEQSVTIQ